MRILPLIIFVQSIMLDSCVQVKTNTFTHHFLSCKNGYISHMITDDKQVNLEIETICRLDSSREITSSPIYKKDTMKFVKLENEHYYLNWEISPVMQMDLCEKLSQIKPDTTVTLGAPYSIYVTVVFLIDKEGAVKQYGIARSTNDSYYIKSTISLLDSFCNETKFSPAKIKNRPVNAIFKISYSFSTHKCLSGVQ